MRKRLLADIHKWIGILPMYGGGVQNVEFESNPI